MEYNRIEHSWMPAINVLMVIGKEFEDWIRYPLFRECLVCSLTLRQN